MKMHHMTTRAGKVLDRESWQLILQTDVCVRIAVSTMTDFFRF